MFAYAPNCPLSNLWNLSDLLPNAPTTAEIRESWKRALNNLRKAHTLVRKQYNRGRSVPCFKAGDYVMLRAHYQSSAINKFSAKLAPRYTGPYQISNLDGGSLQLIDRSGRVKRAHVSQVKPCGADIATQD